MLNIKTENEQLVIDFPGRLDTDYCMKQQNEINDKVKGPEKSVIFNLKQVSYISSIFLRICLNAAKQVGKDNFTIINVTPDVKKVFKIAGFDKILNID